MDTAGLRDTTDFIEAMGVKAARSLIETADLLLFVVDATEGDYTEDKLFLADLDGGEDRPVLVIANKVDLLPAGERNATEARLKDEFKGRSVAFSALPGLISFIWSGERNASNCAASHFPG